MRAASQLRKGKRPLGHIAGCLLAVASALGVWIAGLVDAIAQARIHRTAIERDLHQGRFNHATKNDDDIPHIA